MNKLKIALPENTQNITNYLAALNALQIEPVVISCSKVHLKSACLQEYLDIRDLKPEHYDGLVLPGGVDVCPSLYHQEVAGSLWMNRDLDELQFRTLDIFIKEKKPVFGICRGLQLLNIYFGGDLIQHLPTADRHAVFQEGAPDVLHESSAVKGSWLARVYGEHFLHNSSHHQAVGRLGSGMIVDSRSDGDEVVEAMHHESLPIWGVQWHPERLCLAFHRPGAVDGLRILCNFLQRCYEMSSRRPDVYPDYYI